MRLKHVDGLERKEVAQALGISEKAVKKAIERGLRECRERIERAFAGELCAERERALDALAAGAASAREQRAAEQHLAHCEGCRRRQRALAATQRAAAAVAPWPLAAHAHVAGVGGLVRAVLRVRDWVSGKGGSAARAGHVARVGGTSSVLAAGSGKAAAVIAAAAVAAAAHGSAAHAPAVPTPGRPAPHPEIVRSAPAAAPVRAPAPTKPSGTRRLSPSNASRKRRRRVRSDSPASASTPASSSAPAPVRSSSAPAAETKRTSSSDEFPIY
jgi:hypothetical protein